MNNLIGISARWLKCLSPPHRPPPWEYVVGFLPNLGCKEGKNQIINSPYLQTTNTKVTFKDISCQPHLPGLLEEWPEKQEVFVVGGGGF